MQHDNKARLNAELWNQRALSPDQRFELYDVFSMSYDSTNKERFLDDLSKKHLIIILKNEKGEAKGFSSLALLEPWEGSYALFSGDTIIDKNFRGEQTLALSWIKVVASIAHKIAPHSLYWLLIVKGEKTYRYLPTFFENYSPKLNVESDSKLLQKKEYWANRLFGSLYNPKSGVVEFTESLGHLTEEEALISQSKSMNKEVKFFLEKNPGFAKGHELVCLAELVENNFKKWGRRVFAQVYAEPIQHMIFDGSQNLIELDCDFVEF